MKTFTALAAIAALAAGISVASAQSSMSNSSSATKNDLTASGSAYCSKMKTSGAMDCKFASMAACEKVTKAENGSCIQNPKGATTGSGSASDMNKTPKKQ